MDDRTGIGEAAGNLLAELYSVQDDWRRGQVTTEKYLARVKQLRGCGQRWRSVLFAPTAVKTFAGFSQE